MSQEFPIPGFHLFVPYHLQFFTILQMNRIFRNQRRAYQIEILSCHGIKPHHIEDKPGRHGAAIIISRQTERSIVIVVIHNLSDTCYTQIRSIHPMVEIRSHKTRFVSNIIMFVGKECMKALDKSLLAAAQLYQSRHIMRNTETIFSRQSFIEESTPPWQIPGSHLRIRAIRNQGMVNF